MFLYSKYNAHTMRSKYLHFLTILRNTENTSYCKLQNKVKKKKTHISRDCEQIMTLHNLTKITVLWYATLLKVCPSLDP